MTCSDARPHLSALLDSAGDARDREATARHIGACPACRAELDTLSAADRALKDVLADAAERSAPPGYFDGFWGKLAMHLDEKTPESAASPGREGQGDADIDDLRMLAAATIRRSSEITVPQVPLSMISSTSLAQVVLPMASPSAPAPVAPRSALADLEPYAPPRRRGRGMLIFGAAASVAMGAVAVVLLLRQGGERPAPLPPPGAPEAVTEHGPMPAQVPPPTVQPIPAPVVQPMAAPSSQPSSAPAGGEAPGSPASEPTATVAIPPAVAPSSSPALPAAHMAADPGPAKTPDRTVEKIVDKSNDKGAAGAKPEAKGEAKAETRPDLKPDTKPDTNLETKVDGKVDGLPDVTKPPETIVRTEPEPAKPEAPRPATPKKEEAPKAGEPVGGKTASPEPEKDKKKVDLPNADELLKEVNAPPIAPPPEPGAPAKPAEPTGPRHERLTQEEISSGMESITPEAQACGAKATETGMVTVSVKIKPDGTVADANPAGKSAGTEVGACVAAAVKRAKFVSFDGASMTIKYGFRIEKQEE